MIVNRLSIVPTDDTREYLTNLTRTSLLNIDIDSLSVTIMNTTQDIYGLELPNLVYECTPGTTKPWYSSALNASSLILSLDAPGIKQRIASLNHVGINDCFYPKFNPYLVLVPFMPPNGTRIHRSVIALANAFGNTTLPKLSFTSEFVSTVTLDSPPDMEYQEYQNNPTGKMHGL